VAKPKLFQLKAEVALATEGPLATFLPYARVRVDTGVFHLDSLYDYKIPERLSALIQVGVRVQLPFGSREVEGIVIERVAAPERAGELKSITKVLSPHPIATRQSLQLIDLAAKKYACNPWDLIRSAIAPRVASVDKSYSKACQEEVSREKGRYSFETLLPFIEPHYQLRTLLQKAPIHGSILIVAPDEKDVDLIVSILSDEARPVYKLTADMPRNERYRNYLQLMDTACIVVGTRSAIFAPVNNLSLILIYKESSIDHYEIRSPGWNTRAIAEMRYANEDISLIVTGFSPSIEVASGIDSRTITFNNTKQIVSVRAYSPIDGALLPGRIFSEISKALKKGPVLFMAPRKGYGNALLCAHCRNLASCECGGRLLVASKSASPSCVHCGKIHDGWRCKFCDRNTQYLVRRGIDRASEEISRAFPHYPVIISTGEVMKERIEKKAALVLATPGSQPLVSGGYAAVVILDGLRFFSHTDLRAQERAREMFMESAALISPSGSVLLVMDEDHPIISSIARWNIAPLLKRELSERTELQLPPLVTSVVLVMAENEGAHIADGLRKALQERRLAPSTRIFGATPLGKGQVKIVMHSSKDESDELRSMIHELQRRRSMAKKELFTIRVDPYSL